MAFFHASLQTVCGWNSLIDIYMYMYNHSFLVRVHSLSLLPHPLLPSFPLFLLLPTSSLPSAFQVKFLIER